MFLYHFAGSVTKVPAVSLSDLPLLQFLQLHRQHLLLHLGTLFSPCSVWIYVWISPYILFHNRSPLFSFCSATHSATSYDAAFSTTEDYQHQLCLCFLSASFHSTGNVPLCFKPMSFKEANQYLCWHTAMNDEIAALHVNATWSLVSFDPSINIVGCRWV